MLAVRPTTDASAVNAVLHHPAIASKLHTDDREPGYVEHPALTTYLATIDDAAAGVFLAIRLSRWEVEAHVAILPSYVRRARDLCRLFLKQAFAPSDVQRVTAPVLATLPSAANLCRRLGFLDEGVRRAACRINGYPVDVLQLGLTRNDFCV